MTPNEKLFQDAIASLNTGRFSDAERAFKRILKREPSHVGALNLLTIVLMSTRRNDEAERFAKAAINANEHSDATFYNYGLILKELNRPHEALAQFNKALALNPAIPDSWNNRGTVFNTLRKYDEAISDFDKAISLHPSFAEAFCNKGKSLNEIGRYDEALAAYDRALALRPDLAEAWLGRGNVLSELERYETALAAYERALAIKPSLADAWLGCGHVFLELRRYQAAVLAYDKALAITPDLVEAWHGRGNAFFEFGRYDAALAAYDKALALRSDLAGAWFGRGNVFDRTNRHEEAASAYAQLLLIDPQFPFAKGRLLHQKMLSCDWKDVESLIDEIDQDVAAGKLSAEPFGWQGVATSQRSLQLCAELYTRENFPTRASKLARYRASDYGKVRIGYLSGELRDQATSHLIVGVLELHDRSRFEIYGIDNGWDDQSEVRSRINASVNGIVDIRQLDDQSAAFAVQDKQIDILVNLNGYFGELRMGVFARRCAPLQVNYLGFPGTLGADYMDYIIADQHIIPKGHEQFYTEKVVYLPHCYQANDRKKRIGNSNFTRAELGLPERAFVFCCFNNNYKIVPAVFESWIRILRQVEGSVLWLLEHNAATAANLRKEAAARGIAADRLVFAKLVPLSDHLARLRQADLFLDTLPYNAHTTASDALWAGLPLLTRVGETFAGRVAASLLHAIGLPELITRTQEEYERLALELATHRAKLALIKHKLAQNRLAAPLFNTQLFTRHLESAYEAIYDRYRAGLLPDHLHVQQ
jgi:protein O-GlcNAc transferase